MLKKTSYILLLAIVIKTLPAMSQTSGYTNLSALTKKYLFDIKKSGTAIFSDEYVFKNISGKTYLSTIIKVNENVDLGKFSDLGVLIGTKAGNIWTVQIPPDKLDAFTKVKGIDYIQLDEPVFFNLDSARHDANVDSVHQGILLPQAYTGKEVIVGIIDAGFDYSHPTFLDTSGNQYRIIKAWEQKSSGTPPSGYSYGNELADSASLYEDGSDVDLFSHGSHVAGIAAGSGYGSDANGRKYRGIAFESELIFVGIKPDPDQWTTTGTSNIIDGINYIFHYADSVGKPAVANLSWGCSMGPHDGTSLFSQAVDNLTGEGKIFVCAAGNNGTNNIHLNKTFTPTDTLLKTIVSFSTYLSSKKTWVDAWGDAGENYCVEVQLYSGATAGNSTGFICIDDSVHELFLIGTDNDTCYVTLTMSPSDFNGKSRIFFDIYSKTINRVAISIISDGGTMNMWMGYVKDYTGYYGTFQSGALPGAVTGDKYMTISDFASTHSAIAAAAYASKTTFTNIDGQYNSYTSYVAEGNIAPFSSHGPSADSLTKPDIAAPGLVLVSAINSYDTTYNAGGANHPDVVTCYSDTVNDRTYCYAAMMGTSMASPMTTGIVALMLEANPTLTPALVKYLLQSTAIIDSYTGTITAQGNNVWGFGKINAYAAVKKAWTDANVQNISNYGLDYMIYPNPCNGEFYIDYISDKPEKINVEVFDITGRRIFYVNPDVKNGINTIKVNANNISPGIYFVKISAKNGISATKIILN
jgi:minor extracellular serine protease Vpr